ncbi:MAG: hypothetical protein R3B99_03750 [Polyangiales bacterium]
MPPDLLRASLDELVGEALIAREARRVQVGIPGAAALREERRALESLAGGVEAFSALMVALGATEMEIAAMVERRAMVRLFLDANLRGGTQIEDAEVVALYESSEHPFLGQELDEVREPLRAILRRRRIENAVARWIEVLRGRTVVRMVALTRRDAPRGRDTAHAKQLFSDGERRLRVRRNPRDARSSSTSADGAAAYATVTFWRHATRCSRAWRGCDGRGLPRSRSAVDEVVALKRLTPRPRRSGRAFLAEVKLGRRVTHRNVARTHDVGEHDGVLFDHGAVEARRLEHRLGARGGVIPFRSDEVLPSGARRSRCRPRRRHRPPRPQACERFVDGEGRCSPTSASLGSWSPLTRAAARRHAHLHGSGSRSLTTCRSSRRPLRVRRDALRAGHGAMAPSGETAIEPRWRA